MAPGCFGGVSTQGPMNLILLDKLSTLLMLVDEELVFLLGECQPLPLLKVKCLGGTQT